MQPKGKQTQMFTYNLYAAFTHFPLTQEYFTLTSFVHTNPIKSILTFINHINTQGSIYKRKKYKAYSKEKRGLTFFMNSLFTSLFLLFNLSFLFSLHFFFIFLTFLFFQPIIYNSQASFDKGLLSKIFLDSNSFLCFFPRLITFLQKFLK